MSPTSIATAQAWRTLFRLTVTLALGFECAQLSAQTNSLLSAIVSKDQKRIMVKPQKGRTLDSLHQVTGARVLKRFPAVGDLEILEAPAGIAADALVTRYRQSGLVQYAERDQVVHALVEPNDFRYQNGDCWHLKNLGQYGGVVGADIKATDAWDASTSASNIIIAVLDSGVRYTHEDLAPNLWHNPGEIPGNDVDDDGNGYVDDVYGINTITEDGDPDDDFGHGSHVAGIAGAAGNNTVGVVGVCWQVQLMACKFLNSIGDGLVSDAITCVDYARAKGAKIINLSWGSTQYNSLALYDAIASARAAGIIVVCACGNSDEDNDVNPLYPASFDLDNIVSVAATTRTDEKAPFSSYGFNTVDLGAPGDPIFSCWSTADDAYQYLAGTSMAAPQVAGACALVWARYPTENYSQIIARVLANTDAISPLAGKCASGGRLNVNKALTGPPPPIVTVIASDDSAMINSSNTASFTFTRTGDSSTDLRLYLQFGGTAVPWTDYRRIEGHQRPTLSVPAGETSAKLTIVALTNSTGVNPQTVEVTLLRNVSYVTSSPNSATARIGSEAFIKDIFCIPPTNVVITWLSVPNQNYAVRHKPELSFGEWLATSGIITATGMDTAWTDNVAGANRRFYIVTRSD